MLRYVSRGECRRCAAVAGREEENISENVRCRDKGRFSKMGDSIGSNQRLACSWYMMACNTNGAVMVVRGVLMVMEYRHECRKKEKQYEEYGKLIASVHVPTVHKRKISPSNRDCQEIV